MNKLKTSELTGAALDWAVARAERHASEVWLPECDTILLRNYVRALPFTPSTDWSQGGPIIERERISVISDFHEIEEGWLAESYQDNIQQFGPTPLIAAMRCYVMSRLGDEIEIPQELF